MITKQRQPRKSSETRRAELIQAVLDLLDEVGPEGVTTTALAHRVGLTQTAVFKHFRTKDEIWAATIEALGNRIGPRMIAAARSDGPPLQRLGRLVQEYLSLVQENPAMTALLFYRVPPSGDRSLRDQISERFARLRRQITQLIAEAASAGELRRGLDPENGASLVLGIVQDLLVQCHIERKPIPLDKAARLLAILVESLR